MHNLQLSLQVLFSSLLGTKSKAARQFMQKKGDNKQERGANWYLGLSSLFSRPLLEAFV